MARVYDAATWMAGPWADTVAETFAATGASFSPVIVTVTVALEDAFEPSGTV